MNTLKILTRAAAATAGVAALALVLAPAPAAADFVINDDLIVDGSACIGLDCVNGESFGFETIRLKENNLRIRAFDTSNSASFPTFDWQIVFNESSNGGLNKFAIEDIDSARTPFTIEGGADNNSLYVDTGGRIGFGTNSPVVELHVKDGDTPTLRLEQDGSSGFTPQTWDVAGNETNFFVRDATNGSKLPFRIRPNAPSNSIFVDNDGDIGMGTSSPETQLHVSRGGTADIFGRFSNAGGGMNFGYIDSQDQAFMTSQVDGGNIVFYIGTSPTERMRLVGSNNTITHISGASLNAAGEWTNASSRAYKQDIELLGADTAMSILRDLQPVTYRFKTAPDHLNAGFIAEDVPELVSTPDRKGLASMDFVAVLTKALQEQQRTIEDLTAKLTALESRLAKE